MNARHFLIFLAWTLLVLAAIGCLLFLFTYGDCFDNAACRSAANASMLTILGAGFCVYWLVAILLFRRWTR
jgi:hypothetical protein